MFHLIGQVVFGLVVGVIAKLLVPGRDPGGFLVTILIGIAGSLLGTFVGRAIKRDPNYSAHWVTSILGAIVLLVVYRFVVR
ncbi:MAG TPA: GlsB/YeaQ/YmgE family stress response membrane protein [Vicinamibacterales bacterium]|jgi:uncharacterized membrane protein YeaQ/YmgE (transglycosylase-associated protein family)